MPSVPIDNAEGIRLSILQEHWKSVKFLHPRQLLEEARLVLRWNRCGLDRDQTHGQTLSGHGLGVNNRVSKNVEKAGVQV